MPIKAVAIAKRIYTGADSDGMMLMIRMRIIMIMKEPNEEDCFA